MSGTQRADLLLKLSALAEKHAEILATIDTWDNGKPYNDSLTIDIAEVIQVYKYYGGWADKVYGQVIGTSPEKFAYTLKEPIGVCGQIIPWKSVSRNSCVLETPLIDCSFPALMAAWKLGPALACGNCVGMLDSNTLNGQETLDNLFQQFLNSPSRHR